MKCRNLLCVTNKKTNINLSSADFAQRVVNIKLARVWSIYILVANILTTSEK